MRRFFHSLLFKFGLAVLVTETMILGIVGYFSYRDYHNEIRTQVHHQLEIPGKLINDGLLPYTVLTNEGHLEDLYMEGLVQGYIVNFQDTVEYAYQPELVTKSLPDLLGISLGSFDLAAGADSITMENGSIVHVTPLTGSTRSDPLAYLVLIADREMVQGPSQAFLLDYLVGAVAILLLTSLVLSIVFQYRFYNPIRKIIDTLETFRSGDFDIRLSDPNFRGEMAALRNHVNGMMGTLQNNILDLRTQIQEKKDAEEALRSSEERYRNVYETAPLAFMLWDQDLRVTDWNDYAEEVFGWKREEILGQKFFDYIVPEDLKADLVIVAQNILKGELPSRVINRNITRDGRTIFCEWNNTILYNEEGEVVTGMSLALDITEREEAKQALEWESSLNQTLAELSKKLIDPQQDLEDITCIILDSAKELTGSQHGYVSSIDPFTKDNICHTFTEMLANECKIDEENQNIIFPIGENGYYPTLWGYALNTRQPFFTNSLAEHPASTGLPVGHIPLRNFLSIPVLFGEELVGQIALGNAEGDYDTQHLEAIKRLGELYALALHRLQVEKTLKESEEKFSTAFLSSPDMVVISRIEDGTIIECNQTFLDAFEYQKSEVIGKSALALGMWVDPEDRQDFMQTILNYGENRSFDSSFRTKTGEIMPALVSGRLIEINQEPCAITIARDLKEIKAIENALVESENRYRSIFENNHAIMLLIDPDSGKIEDANPAACQFYGYTIEELTNLKIFEINQLPKAQVIEKLKETKLGKISVLQFVHRLANDSERNVEVYTGPITVDGKTHLFSIIQDITTRIKREKELETIARLSTVLRDAQTLEEMLKVVLDQTSLIFNAAGSSVGLRDPNSGETIVKLANGESAAIEGNHLPPGTGIYGKVISSGKPYQCDDIQNDPYYAWPEKFEGKFALLGVPLIAHHQVIGALLVRRPAPFMENDLRLLTAFGEMTANAIHLATMHEQTQRQLEQLSALRKIDQAISTSMELNYILDVLLQQVINHLKVDAACVSRFNPEAQTLTLIDGVGFTTTKHKGVLIRVGEGCAGQVALEQEVLIDHLENEANLIEKDERIQGENFQFYMGIPLLIKGEFKGVFEVFCRSHFNPDSEWIDFCETLAGQTAIALDNTQLIQDLNRTNIDLMMAYDNTLEGWARALELRDKETKGHSQRVTEITTALARDLGFSEEECLQVRRGALLHDIGKMGIPDQILNKPGPLSREEWEIMRMHPLYAHEMLYPIRYLQKAMAIPLYHHERWDGSGYPHGLKEEEIPLAARIFAVVDVWDALRTDRPYRKAWEDPEIMHYIRTNAGNYFDPEVVNAFLRFIERESLA